MSGFVSAFARAVHNPSISKTCSTFIVSSIAVLVLHINKYTLPLINNKPQKCFGNKNGPGVLIITLKLNSPTKQLTCMETFLKVATRWGLIYSSLQLLNKGWNRPLSKTIDISRVTDCHGILTT